MRPSSVNVTAYATSLSIIAILTFAIGIVMPVQALAQSSAPDFDAIDKFVQDEVDAIRIPGLALAIVHGDQVVHQKGFGIADPSGRPVTPQTPFNIASVSKTFTALSVLQLAEDGRIELEAPVRRYLPWFQVADPDASAQITVYDLLNHTSGIPMSAGNDYPEKDDTSEFALEKRVRALSTVQLDRAVGVSHEYSNANYDTLGLIVQVVSSQAYETYVQQNIFAPLEMKNSFSSRLDAQPYGPATGYRMWFGFPFSYSEVTPRAHLPSGYQFSSAEDMAHLLIAYLNGGMYQGVSVLSEDGIQTMQHSSVSAGPDCSTYSMSWSHGPQCDSSVLRVSGDLSNFKARLRVLPEEKWGLVVLMNTQVFAINGPRQNRIDEGVLELLRGKTPVVANPHNVQILGGKILIAVMTLLLIFGMIRSITRLRQQNRIRMDGFPRMGRHVVLPLVLDILWVLMLTGMVQIAAGSSSTHPLSFMLENVPDMGWMIVLSAVMALGLGAIRTILTFKRLIGN